MTLYTFVLENSMAAGNDYDGKVAAAEFDMMVELAAKNVRRLILAGYTAQLLNKYMAMYYGCEDMEHRENIISRSGTE